MSARRPDYDDYMRVLDLPTDSGPWEQLTRSQGTQGTEHCSYSRFRISSGTRGTAGSCSRQFPAGP